MTLPLTSLVTLLIYILSYSSSIWMNDQYRMGFTMKETPDETIITACNMIDFSSTITELLSFLPAWSFFLLSVPAYRTISSFPLICSSSSFIRSSCRTRSYSFSSSSACFFRIRIYASSPSDTASRNSSSDNLFHRLSRKAIYLSIFKLAPF